MRQTLHRLLLVTASRYVLPFTMLVLVSLSPELRAAEPKPGVIEGSEISPVAIGDTLQFEMRSRSDQVYRIFVAPPRGPVPEGGWPVMYHPDGNTNFPLLVAATDGQALDQRPSLLVGIGYPNADRMVLRSRRTFDLTFPADEAWLKTTSGPLSNMKSGGCGPFLQFIQEELKPEIERRFPVNRSRQTLFGHSFGGLFTLHTMLTQPESFQTYVASSPSLWWNAGSLKSVEEEFITTHTGKTLNIRLLVTNGEAEALLPAGNSEKRPPGFRQSTRMGNIHEMAERLRQASIDGLQVVDLKFPGEHHGSVVLPAASRGVRFSLSEK